MPQTCDLAEIQIRREGKIDDQTQEPRTACGDSEPESCGPEIEVNESDNPQVKEEDRKVRPLLGPADFLRGPGLHDGQLSESNARHRKSGECEKQILPGPAF